MEEKCTVCGEENKRLFPNVCDTCLDEHVKQHQIKEFEELF